jgi:hypothetical protein
LRLPQRLEGREFHRLVASDRLTERVTGERLNDRTRHGDRERQRERATMEQVVAVAQQQPCMDSGDEPPGREERRDGHVEDLTERGGVEHRRDWDRPWRGCRPRPA